MRDLEKVSLITWRRYNHLNMKNSPQLTVSHSIYKDTHIEVMHDVLKQGTFSWNQVYLQWINKNSICVIPFENNGVYLVQQYRHASRKKFWQFPGGLMEPKISEKKLAEKELAEEAGFKPGGIIKIGSFSPEPGLASVQVKVFLATQLRKVERRLEKSELGMKLKFFPLPTVEKMIKKGQIECGITLSSYLILKLHLS